MKLIRFTRTLLTIIKIKNKIAEVNGGGKAA